MLRYEHSYSIVYVPNAGWTGTDYFTYTTLLGVSESAPATATLHVRKCRAGNCRNDVTNDIALTLR